MENLPRKCSSVVMDYAAAAAAADVGQMDSAAEADEVSTVAMMTTTVNRSAMK